MELIEEIFANNILLNGMDSIAKPDTINKLIINIIKNHNEHEQLRTMHLDSAVNGNLPNVQLLKHWSQMNGTIFKSVFLIYI